MEIGNRSAAALGASTTLGELFAWRVSQTPQAEAYRQFDAQSAQWISYTWAEMAARVAACAAALAALELPHAAKVAILLPNGVEAVCIDQASLALGMVPVPMHALDNPDSIAYIVNDCDASVLVVTNYAQWAAIAGAAAAMPALKLVAVAGGDIPAHPAAPASGPVMLVALRDWLAVAAGSSPARLPAVAAADLAAIVYTSGTTGKPKGVMLTHANILANVRALTGCVKVGTADVFLSFLPLSHTFERTVGYYLPIAAGSCVAYVRSVAQIADDLQAVRPTALVSVPRIYERFHAKLEETMAASGAVTRALFALAQAVGWRQFSRRQHLPPAAGGAAWLDALLEPLTRRLVARKVLARFGGRLRFAVCGGAPMSQAVAQCFLGMGLPLLQGYGMTETSPVVCNNTVEDNWPATVGKVLDGVQVRIGENQELQVRGASVMRGYWKRPEDSANTFTGDGWLRTGDQASIVDGRVRITGRIKEIIVTSTGEKVAPADLELAIIADALFDQAFVIGENRPFVAAFVVLNPAAWAALARRLNVADEPASLGLNAVRDAALAQIQQMCKSFPAYAVPRAVRMELTPWSIENSLMTPTLKLKRKNLLAHFEGETEDVYRKRG
ncbi:AMP-dependent synthetase/ligase [Janthinobacterium fluminis]|uniref:Long-chain fatty acid--CoA ligase n=1 Tax=Janthinobacterium fluminis TaxID=2987524 RepID=A0ABT5JW01_9BURK|nr:long-chain fatty acid--CoA ligase [Janthinobacterium fluminis]MDC8756764.1 long-chain fatty acid--CoA ligase [Janthinobacterium fluminis]